MLTQDSLRKALSYDEVTGRFSWNASTGCRHKGAEAGTENNQGYVVIKIRGQYYRAHKLVFLYVDGYIPEHEIDHINRIRSDNRRENLREVTRQCNMRNSSMQCNNKSAIKGVCWDAWAGRWYVSIKVDMVHKHLGRFRDLLDAAYMRYAAEQCLGFPDCDINSSAKQFIEASK